jgi:hypothetical protein
MKGDKRKPRAYKITDKYYVRAQKKAAKTDKSLAERVEEFVIEYGKPVPKRKAIQLPADYLMFSKIGVLNAEGAISPLLVNKKKK